MQINETGVFLQVYPTAVPTSGFLTGTTCYLIVRSPQEILYALGMSISEDGSYAYRYTLNTDFAVAGDYGIQLYAQFSNGNVLTSPIQTINVGYSFDINSIPNFDISSGQGGDSWDTQQGGEDF